MIPQIIATIWLTIAWMFTVRNLGTEGAIDIFREGGKIIQFDWDSHRKIQGREIPEILTLKRGI